MVSLSSSFAEVYNSFEDMVYLILELFSEVVQHHLCYLGEVRYAMLTSLFI